jgi:peptide-methionine (R)-S-oxide reductase
MTNDEWKNILSAEQYRVLREKGTEQPFTGHLLHNNEDGMYRCAACNSPLFDSGTKFDSHCGWPSFNDVVGSGSVELKTDTSHGMERVEVVCSKCGGHLGHLFEDAPDQPTGLRYCINSVSLNFEPKGKA